MSVHQLRPEEAFDLQELALELVVSYQVGAQIDLKPSGRAANALQH